MKISIITVCFNSVKTIEKTILSVINQNYENYEYIIIDGQSTDGTKEIIKKYQSKIDKFITEPDNGIYEAINKGIKLADGKIISILHSNDVYFDNFVLKKVTSHFVDDDNLDIAIGDVNIKKKFSSSEILRFYSSKYFKPWMLRFGISPPHPGSFIKKSNYEKHGYYDILYKIASDFDLYVRYILKEKLKYKITNECYVIMRAGGLSNSGIKSHIDSTKEILKSLKKSSIYSNIFLVLLRFPFKLIQYIKK